MLSSSHKLESGILMLVFHLIGTQKCTMLENVNK